MFKAVCVAFGSVATFFNAVNASLTTSLSVMFVGAVVAFALSLFSCNLVLASAIAVANAVLAASISADVPALLAALSKASCKAAFLAATSDVSSAA